MTTYLAAMFTPAAWITLRMLALLAWDLITERNQPVRIPLEISHDGTRIVIWHENEMLADYCFEKSKWRGKPKKMKELRPDEVCEGR